MSDPAVPETPQSGADQSGAAQTSAAQTSRNQSSRSTGHRRLSGRAWYLHGARWLIIIAVALLIRLQSNQDSVAESAADPNVPAITLLETQRFFPAAVEVLETDPTLRTRSVLGVEGEVLGFVLQTAPESRDQLGYSGPTNTLLAFDADRKLIGMAIVNSGDTPDYVEQVIGDPRFLAQFQGLSWEDIGQLIQVDAVSGATLTSVAMGAGIIRRLGGNPPELKFAEPVTVTECQRWFPGANSLATSIEVDGALDVLAANGERLGWVMRTTPDGDGVLGYQGPTDTLIAFDTRDRVQGIAVHATFETPEYVDYVREDNYFLTLFDGKTPEELAQLDVFEDQIEGVSGATMTSTAMAEAIILRAAGMRPPPQSTPVREPLDRVLQPSDFGMIAIILLGLVMTFTHLRGVHWLRTVWQIALVSYFVTVNPDLLSQALLSGWVRHGIPWSIAPGLVLLAAAALAVPAVSRRQTYCHHVCPFGAAQQLTRRLSPIRVRVPRWLHRTLSFLPPVLLLWVVAVSMGLRDFNLAALEPFDAFNWRLATTSSIVIAVVGLIVSLFVPMAYCQYGCPTGALLNYVRLQSRAQLTRRDLAAVLCLVLAVVLAIIS